MHAGGGQRHDGRGADWGTHPRRDGVPEESGYTTIKLRDKYVSVKFNASNTRNFRQFYSYLGPCVFNKPMPDSDYGQFMQGMRKRRGLTQEQVAQASGVSPATIQKLEYSAEKLTIRAPNLDSILTVFAQRGLLTQSEISTLSAATGRVPESFMTLNSPFSQASNEGPVEELRARIYRAADDLISVGMGELLFSQLEAMVNHLDNDTSDDVSAKPPQRFKVVHPMREVNGKRIQEISHYEVPDEPDVSSSDTQGGKEGNG